MSIKRWTEDELSYLEKHAGSKSAKVLAAMMNRSKYSVEAMIKKLRANRMGVRRDDDVRLAQVRERSIKGLESRRARKSAHLPPAKFYGEKIGNARVFRADQRPGHLDKNPDKLPRQKNYVSGSTLSEAI